MKKDLRLIVAEIFNPPSSLFLSLPFPCPPLPLHHFPLPLPLPHFPLSCVYDIAGHPCRIYNEQNPRKEFITESKDLGPKHSHLESTFPDENTDINQDEVSNTRIKDEQSPKLVDDKGVKIITKAAVQESENTDSKTVSWKLKRPALSLERFLRETEKRRRVVLDEIICMTD